MMAGFVETEGLSSLKIVGLSFFERCFWMKRIVVGILELGVNFCVKLFTGCLMKKG